MRANYRYTFLAFYICLVGVAGLCICFSSEVWYKTAFKFSSVPFAMFTFVSTLNGLLDFEESLPSKHDFCEEVNSDAGEDLSAYVQHENIQDVDETKLCLVAANLNASNNDKDWFFPELLEEFDRLGDIKVGAMRNNLAGNVAGEFRSLRRVFTFYGRGNSQDLVSNCQRTCVQGTRLEQNRLFRSFWVVVE